MGTVTLSSAMTDIGQTLAQRTLRIEALEQALEDILRLDPSDTNEGYNEWGEAECFHRARKIAHEALGEGR